MHVRQRRAAVQGASRFSAWRREPNSHEAAKPPREALVCRAISTTLRCWELEPPARGPAKLLGATAPYTARALRWWLSRSVSSSGRRQHLRVCRNSGQAARTPGPPPSPARSGRHMLRGNKAYWFILGLQRRKASTALPNPSFKRSPNGVALGPRGSAAYHLPRGPSATPSVPA